MTVSGTERSSSFLQALTVRKGALKPASLQSINAASLRFAAREGFVRGNDDELFPLEGLTTSGQRTPEIRAREHVKNLQDIQTCRQFLENLPATWTPHQQAMVKQAFESLLTDARHLLNNPSDHAQRVLMPMLDKIQRTAGLSFEEAMRLERLDASVPNFAEVLPGLAYRGGQPSEAGIRWLHQQGFKTIVNLRDPQTEPETGYPGFTIQDEERLVRRLGMNYVSLSSPDRSTDVRYGKIEQMLELVNNPANGPVFFHCMAGIGRTGIMAGTLQKSRGYSNREIIAELRRRCLEPTRYIDHARQANLVIGYDVAAHHRRPR